MTAARVVGLFQILVCFCALAYTGWHGASYNQFLKEANYKPAIVCEYNSKEYVLTEIKHSQRCVLRSNAERWNKDSIAIKVGISIFLIALFVPALALKQMSFKGWNR